jgi:hypothetical protein
MLSKQEIESLLRAVRRRGWTWCPERQGLWNADHELLVTASMVEEDLEAALTLGFVEAVVSSHESCAARKSDAPAWIPPPLQGGQRRPG